MKEERDQIRALLRRHLDASQTCVAKLETAEGDEAVRVAGAARLLDEGIEHLTRALRALAPTDER